MTTELNGNGKVNVNVVNTLLAALIFLIGLFVGNYTVTEAVGDNRSRLDRLEVSNDGVRERLASIEKKLDDLSKQITESRR
jgi:hypothetical protein